MLRALVVLLLAATLAACGEDEPAETQRVLSPLTGLPFNGSGEPEHPVYVAKIDNTEKSKPQVGLGSADLVVEELVEGGITRLAAFYYSKLPEKVGPVRSTRLSDVGIVQPADGTLVASGGAKATVDRLEEAGVGVIDMNNEHVARVKDGHDELHSVMADLSAIGKKDDGDASRPDDYFPWGSENERTGGRPATRIEARLSGSRTSSWTYRDGSYRLENGFMPGDDEFRPATVIACAVRTTLADYKDPGGADVPVSHFEGSGQAWIFNSGTVVQATWRKSDEGSPVTFEKDGVALEVPPGKVWLELVPGKGAVPAGKVTFSR